jgi:spermidine synthase
MNSAARRTLTACLFFSGAASLIMEVAWSRKLSLILGNSHQAVATVVAAMMTGLFLGSLLASRWLHRIPNLVLAYGKLEMGIGIYGALTPLIFTLLGWLLGPLYSLPGPAFLFVRFLLVFLVLLPPSAGMGATLPVATAAISTNPSGKPTESGLAGGRLYGLNTLGAFIGTLAGGFLLLPGLGLLKATLTGAATSFAVGGVVWLLSGSLFAGARRRKAETVAEKAAPEGLPLVLPLYAASGFIAMVYEIVWTRVMAPIAGSSVYSFTLILAAILAGIGAGSLVLSTGLGRRIHPGRGFVVGQILLGVTSFASLWGLKSFPNMMLSVAARHASDPQAFLLWEFLAFGAIVLPPALLLGALFPFASRLLQSLQEQGGAEVGRVYAWNTAGSLLGSLAAGFFLVETLGSRTTLGIASLASLYLGVAGLILAPGRIFRPVAGAAAILLALVIPFFNPAWDLYMMTTGVSQLLRNIRKLGDSASVDQIIATAQAPDVHVLFHKEGKTSTVTVVREWMDRWLRVDGKTDASTSAADMLTQSLLGHIPFFFAPDPKAVAVIGFGSGVTAHAALTHPVKVVDIIEIEQQVLEAAPFFADVNGKPLEDPRHRLIVDDARTALTYRPQRYDIIISEPSNPWMAGVNNLFTTEFYTLVKRRLNAHGIFCQWIQSYEMSDETLKVLLDTLTDSFPHVHLFGSYMGSDLIFIASMEPIALAPGAEKVFPDAPAVAADLLKVGVGNVADLGLLYTSAVSRPAEGGLRNNDDNSLIQYRAPLELLRGLEPRRDFLRASKADLMDLLFPGQDEKSVLLALGRAAYSRQALPTLDFIAGSLKEMGEADAAGEMKSLVDALQAQLQRAARVQQALVAAEARAAAHDPQQGVVLLADALDAGLVSSEEWARVGMVYMTAGMYPEAEESLDHAVQLGDPRFQYQSLAARGAVRFRLGRHDEGRQDLASAKQIDPQGAVAYLLGALALHDTGNREAAIAELREGVKVAPADERLSTYLEAYLKESASPSRPPAR